MALFNHVQLPEPITGQIDALPQHYAHSASRVESRDFDAGLICSNKDGVKQYLNF